ncbi:MAG: hypothetical protein M5T52_14665 [Ignavibacteriaceae bacterium]|nr:hypothetical protein [Ignavibacteriaceae bacterium]
MRSDISVSKERQNSVKLNISRYENEIIELNSRTEAKRNIIAQALHSTELLTQEIDKKRELKDDLKLKIEEAGSLLDQKEPK